MKSSKKNTSVQIVRRNSIVIAVIGTGSLLLNPALKQPAMAQVHHSMSAMPDMPIANQGANSSLVASAPITTATVIIQGFKFEPANLTLKQGGKVTFINKDSTPHTVTPGKGAMFTGTGRLSQNASKTVTFNTVGDQNYFCEIHPSMMGKITVVK